MLESRNVISLRTNLCCPEKGWRMMPRPVLGAVVVAAIAGGGCHHRVATAAATPPAPIAAPAAPHPPAAPPPPRAAAVHPPAPLTEQELFARKSLAELNAEHPLSDVFFDYDQDMLR